jgi:alkylation response protein AidB-like acyl-CoA dehydrogenase
MDFSLTEEQSMLEDSVARFIDTDYDFETRQKIARSELGYSRDIWRVFAELGWIAMPFSENDGGLGGGPVELMLMMQQFGRGLVVEPFLPTVVLAGGILSRAADSTQKGRWLAPLIAGDLQAALAFAEPQGRFDLADIATTAAGDGDDFVLRGRKCFVLNGPGADLLIVPARTSGMRSHEAGITLFAVPGDTHGIVRSGYSTVDGHRAADIRLEDVRVSRDAVLGVVGDGYEALRATLDEATLAICAEAVGIQRSMHDKTVDYAKSRVQFGVPIGSFQALQHRMVDNLMACEQCRSSLYRAAMLAEAGDSAAAAAISGLKHQIGTSGRRVAQEAVQIHGGMGVTWELDIAHYFKRFSAIEILFGNADWHLDRYVELTVLPSESI